MSTVYDNTVAVSVSIHRFGNSKGIDKETLKQVMPGVGEEAIERYLHTSRKLVNCAEYDAVVTLDTAYSMQIKHMSVPSYFRRGIYLLPQNQVERFQEASQQYTTERQEAIEQLRKVWLQRWHESQAQTAELGWLPCPLWSEVVQCFYVERKFIDLGVPGKLQFISPETWDAEQEAMRERLQQVEREITALLRAEVCKLTEHLVSRLHGLHDGTLKKFHASNFENLSRWCQEFLGGRNVVNDVELQGVVKQLEEVLQQYSADDLPAIRQSMSLRVHVTQQFQEIATQLVGLAEAVPQRAVYLEE